MERCDYCDRRVGARGVRRREGLFCGRGCARRRYPPEFCSRCRRDTTAQSTGNLSTFNGVGFTLIRVLGGKPCRDCGSVVARVWFTFGFPIIPCSRYLVLWIDEPWIMGEGSFLARKLR
jgi:hypothetical protein